MKWHIQNLFVFCLACWAIMIPVAAILKAARLRNDTCIAIWIVVGLVSMAVGAFAVDRLQKMPDYAKSKLSMLLFAMALLIWAITSAATK
jgi:hypothetical protein